MLIDCSTCSVRGTGCSDCVVSALLGPPDLDAQEQAAVAVLARSGLVSPLRLVPNHQPPDPVPEYRAEQTGS